MKGLWLKEMRCASFWCASTISPGAMRICTWLGLGLGLIKLRVRVRVRARVRVRVRDRARARARVRARVGVRKGARVGGAMQPPPS